MLLTTKYFDGMPLHRYEKMLSQYGLELMRFTLASWIIQCGEHLEPLLSLMRGHIAGKPRSRLRYDPRSDAERTGSRPYQPILDLGERKQASGSKSRVVRLNLLLYAGCAVEPAGKYRGYVMADDYAGYANWRYKWAFGR